MARTADQHPIRGWQAQPDHQEADQRGAHGSSRGGERGVMSPTRVDDLPAVLGLLTDAIVTKYLSRGMQAGQESPPQGALRKATTALPDSDPRWRVGPVR